MQQLLWKRVANVALAISSTLVAAQSVYADAYLRKATGESVDWLAYKGKVNKVPDDFAEINKKYFGNALYMTYWPIYDTSYVAVPGEAKSNTSGVFKIQKLMNGSNQGLRTEIVLPSKESAEQFCADLTTVVHGKKDSAGSERNDRTVLVSSSVEGTDQAVAVAYKVAQGDELIARIGLWHFVTEERKLTSAKKYFICPNPLGRIQDPGIDDENVSTGVKASGLINSDWHYDESDRDGLYHVICNNPEVPENEFVWNPSPPIYCGVDCGMWMTYEGDKYTMLGFKSSVLEDIDATLGANYCAGKLKQR